MDSVEKQIRAVIIDDEPLSIEEIRTLINDFREITIVGEAGNVDEAVALIRRVNPDLVFLDIQLEGRSAFEILDKVDSKFDLIFITAYDKYAIRAFEINALDYLLKPVRKERFKVTIKRYIKHEKTSKPFIEKLEINDRFLVQKSNHLVFVKICDILAIEADNDYSIVYTNDNKKSLVPKTIREWEQILPEKYFLRIHRGTVINLEKIERIEKWHSNTLKVYIKNKSVPVYVSQRYASDIKRKFKL